MTSGRASVKSSIKSLKYRLTGSRSQSCWAISGSRSHTPTISQSPIRNICVACASAIFPHPTMPTLSMLPAFRAAVEINAQRFAGRHFVRPPQPLFQLGVAVGRRPPLGIPAPAIESRRQLSLRIIRVFLPQITERIAEHVGDVCRLERTHVLFVHFQEATTRWRVVVHYVEYLSLDAADQASQHNGFRTVIDVGKRYGVEAAEVQERPKSPDAHARRNLSVTWTINAARPYCDVRDGKFFRELANNLFLFDLRVAVRASRMLRVRLDRTGLVESS